MANEQNLAPDSPEWKTRCDLAILYRLADIFDMSDLIYNHISARVPGRDNEILINPFGKLYKEISASNLVRIDFDGNILDLHEDVGPDKVRVNRAGVTIHSAIHIARPDLHCVIHSHSAAGMAVSAQKEGLLPITQHAMMFYGRVGYHDYESFATAEDERERLARDLADREVLILRNHGMLVAGRTIAEAFHSAYHLERACLAQVMAQGGDLILPPADVAQKTANRMRELPLDHYEFFWEAVSSLLPNHGSDARV